MKREKNLHFLRMAVMIAIGVPAACMAVRAAEIPAAPAEDDMAFRLAGVTVEAKRPDWESKLSPGTVTVIRPVEFKGEQKDLADFLKMVPGVHVRARGSIRSSLCAAPRRPRSGYSWTVS